MYLLNLLLNSQKMSYSRFGGRGSGHWYTFWCAQDERTESRDTAIFEVYGVAQFAAKELRENMLQCMQKVKEIDPHGDVVELAIYAKEFLSDVDMRYTRKNQNYFN